MEHAVQREKVVALAMEIFGDPLKAERWLNQPKQQLQGQSPAQVMQNSDGLHKVEQLLIALQEGYF